jgi:hypothetical protein
MGPVPRIEIKPSRFVAGAAMNEGAAPCAIDATADRT